MRGTSNTNRRGNTDDRRKRKFWLIDTYLSDHRAYACRCYRCGILLDYSRLTVDRIIPGARGGTYRRNNIRPACAQCNSETGGSVRK